MGGWPLPTILANELMTSRSSDKLTPTWFSGLLFCRTTFFNCELVSCVSLGKAAGQSLYPEVSCAAVSVDCGKRRGIIHRTELNGTEVRSARYGKLVKTRIGEGLRGGAA